MTWLRPPPGDEAGVAYEFFAPFAHVEGRWEWCRVRSPTHGVFDCFVALGPSPSEPATVVVAGDAGARFLRDRYPECEAVRVPAFDLALREDDHGRTVEGRVRAPRGPVGEAAMRFTAPPGALPRQVAYGGEGKPVWGSRRFTCWGVDLVLPARVRGFVRHADGREEALDGPGLLTLGSFGRIAPLG